MRKKDVTASARLFRAQTNIAKPLPKIRGAVCAQWRIYKGKRLGPYYFLFWREGGKLRKRYVKRADVAATIAACTAYREKQREQRTSHAELMRWIRGYNQTCKEMERWIQNAR